jgi:hypothetical protein
MADVKSVNVLLPDMWSRLLANYFLLRREQFFATDTYEARWHTALKGEWDLAGGIIAVKPVGEGRREIAPQMAVVDTRHPAFLRGEFGRGWHAEEYSAQPFARWRWTQGDAEVRVTNPHRAPRSVVVTIDGWSLGDRDLVVVGADGGATPAQRLDGQRGPTRFAPVTVPPGESTLTLRSLSPPVVPPGETRAVSVCVFGLELEVRER